MMCPYSDGGGGGQSVRQIISRGGKEGGKRDRVAAVLNTYTRSRVGATNGNPSEYPFAKSTSVTSSPASTSKVPLANIAGHKMHTGSTRGREEPAGFPFMGACCSTPPSVGPLLFSHKEKWDGLTGSQTDPNSCGKTFGLCLLNGKLGGLPLLTSTSNSVGLTHTDTLLQMAHPPPFFLQSYGGFHGSNRRLPPCPMPHTAQPQ